jgi:transposase-like protein
MEKLTRRRYTLEYKQEAVRLVVYGQEVSAAAKTQHSYRESSRA